METNVTYRPSAVMAEKTLVLLPCAPEEFDDASTIWPVDMSLRKT